MRYTLQFLLPFLLSVVVRERIVAAEYGGRLSSGQGNHFHAAITAATHQQRKIRQDVTTNHQCTSTTYHKRQRQRLSFLTRKIVALRGGGWKCIPAGWHPYGYQITALAEAFLAWEGSKESDLGRFLISLKDRKTRYAVRTAWLEVLKNSKSAQAMRIYKNVDDLIRFCLKAKFID